MAVPVHTSSPINPHLMSLPQTAPTTTAASTRTLSYPASIQANTTATTANSAHSAQPGAGVPIPTSTASSQYGHYTPTRTTTAPPVLARQSPPPPQPGQAPTPKPTPSRNTRRPSYAPPSYAVPPPQPQRSQSVAFNLPPIQTPTPSIPISHLLPSPRIYEPIRSQTPSSTTTTDPYHQTPSQTQSSAVQFTIPQYTDLSHPPGYRQDSITSFHDRPLEDVENKTHTPSPTRRGMGLLDYKPIYETPGEDSPMWDAAVNWAKAAGKRLSVGEAHIWKALNGEK